MSGNMSFKPTESTIKAASDYIAGIEVAEIPLRRRDFYNNYIPIFNKLTDLNHEPTRSEISAISVKISCSSALVKKLWYSLLAAGYEPGMIIRRPSIKQSTPFTAAHYFHKPGPLTCSRLKDLVEVRA